MINEDTRLFVKPDRLNNVHFGSNWYASLISTATNVGHISMVELH